MDPALPPTGGSRDARIAGLAYLVTIAAGLFAEAFARASIVVGGDPAGTAINFHASEFLYRTAVLADCVMIGAYAVVTALLYRLFAPANPAT